VNGAGASARVAAVIVDFATPDRTVVAVRALQASLVPLAAVIVVENGGGAGESLRVRLPGVDVIATGANLGFAGGSNVGIARALEGHADWVLLVNSDVVLGAAALGTLLTVAARHLGTGILAPLVVRSDEPGVVDSAGISYHRGTGRMRHLGHADAVARVAGREAYAVPAVMGCAMLVRREVVERVGLLDDSYFFSFEDIDFCLRAGGAGFGVLCVPTARALHQGQASIGRRSARRIYFATRNHLRLASGSGGSAAVRTARAASVLALNAAFVLRSADAPLVAGMVALGRGAWHHVRGRAGAD
jgi:GT2 family glycosyltransferase